MWRACGVRRNLHYRRPQRQTYRALPPHSVGECLPLEALYFSVGHLLPTGMGGPRSLRWGPLTRNSILMKDDSPHSMHLKVARLITRFRNGNLSAQMTLMYWLKLGQSVEQIEAQLQTLRDRSAKEDARLFTELSVMLHDHREGCLRIATMVGSGVDSNEAAPTIDEGIAFCKRLFDWSSQQLSEASVALYSLGSPALLAAATEEIVTWLRQHQLVSSDVDALEIGCGIGRFEEALSPVLRTVTGVDVSSEMVRRARSRCEGLPNVSVELCDGRDLARFNGASFDLVLAVDCFPYLFQSGWPLLARHFHEARRVLRPGGALAVFELSYGRSLEADRADFKRLAAESRLEVVVGGEQPFHAWDGIAFMARRSHFNRGDVPLACPEPLSSSGNASQH